MVIDQRINLKKESCENQELYLQL